MFPARRDPLLPTTSSDRPFEHCHEDLEGSQLKEFGRGRGLRMAMRACVFTVVILVGFMVTSMETGGVRSRERNRDVVDREVDGQVYGVVQDNPAAFIDNHLHRVAESGRHLNGFSASDELDTKPEILVRQTNDKSSNPIIFVRKSDSEANGQVYGVALDDPAAFIETNHHLRESGRHRAVQPALKSILPQEETDKTVDVDHQ